MVVIPRYYSGMIVKTIRHHLIICGATSWPAELPLHLQESPAGYPPEECLLE